MASEHVIRLRGGWERLDEAGLPTERLTLPLPRMPQVTSAFRLVRQFGQPPHQPGRERVWLLMEAVLGLRKIWLDGRLMAELSPQKDRLELELVAPGETRHRLTLEIEPVPARPGAETARPWGIIALAIRSE